MAIASVHPAGPTDVPHIARIQRDTWRAAYAELLPAEVLADLDTEQAWADVVAASAAPATSAASGGSDASAASNAPAKSDTSAISDVTAGSGHPVTSDVPGRSDVSGMSDASATSDDPSATSDAAGTDTATRTVHLFVATEGEWTVGFCSAGLAPEAEVANADGTLPADAATVALIGTLLVEPRWGRRGHGGRLLATAATALREDGATRGIAWIPEADDASRRFYAGINWQPDGLVRTLDAGGRPLREIRVSGGLDLSWKSADLI